MCNTRDRVGALYGILRDHEISYETISFKGCGRKFTNIYVAPRSGNLWLMAHHDVVFKDLENANDNTASILNAIEVYMRCRDIGLAFTDGEEPPAMGAGARMFATTYPKARVINLELTGIGGWENVGIMRKSSPLYYDAYPLIGCDCHAPMNDASVLVGSGVDAICLFTCMRDDMLDGEMVSACHTARDSIDRISEHDMVSFQDGLVNLIDHLNTK